MKISLAKLLRTGLLACTALPVISCSDTFPGSTSLQLSPGVSEELATYRKQQISNLAYAIDLTIPEKKEAPVMGAEKISFYLAENIHPLQIDFKEDSDHLKDIRVNGAHISIEHTAEHILIPPQALQKGPNTVEIEFIAGDLSLNRNDDYLYTLLVPDRARTLFPVFDQPDLKASFQLSLNLPLAWMALSNAPLKDSLVGDQYKTYHFAPSDTISTYLFSFTAGKFERVSRRLNGRLMHFYHRETDQEKLEMSIDPIFRLHAKALDFMETYTRIPYPFQKFDFVAIPDFQYGGMEHVGAINYKAATLFLDAGATKDQYISRSSLIAHETAHMWFGDLVTMQWFNDVWMKEVFANFMADKITQVSLAGTNYDLKFLIDHFPAAYKVDRTAGANPIRQPLNNLQDAGSLYGGIIYHKAPVVMRQLERLTGKEILQQGLQEYLQRYAHSNASWPQLIELLDARTSTDLATWNQVWVNEPGRPVFDWALEAKKGKITRLQISQQAEDGSQRIWPQHFEVALVYPDTVKEISVAMNSTVLSLKEAIGEEEPLFLLFNSTGQGYGVFPVDVAMTAEKLYQVQDPVARASAYINLYENMLNGRYIAPQALLRLYRKGFGQELEELNLKLLTGYAGNIYWRLLPDDTRKQLAKEIEHELWNALQQNPWENSRKLLFKAYQHIALSQKAQDRLYKIWKEEKAPEAITLTEDDYTALALALAVRDYPASGEILETQLARIENPDRRKRLQFIIPALSTNDQARDAFFESLKSPVNREKEAWVQAALSYLHHPLRRDSSQKYLAESLGLLGEIQQTGDIFFPQAWLQATLGAYANPEAAQVVRNFLADNPDYNPRLRAKILQAADDLFRAEKLIEKEASP